MMLNLLFRHKTKTLETSRTLASAKTFRWRKQSCLTKPRTLPPEVQYINRRNNWVKMKNSGIRLIVGQLTSIFLRSCCRRGLCRFRGFLNPVRNSGGANVDATLGLTLVKRQMGSCSSWRRGSAAAVGGRTIEPFSPQPNFPCRDRISLSFQVGDGVFVGLLIWSACLKAISDLQLLLVIQLLLWDLPIKQRARVRHPFPPQGENIPSVLNAP